jgi:hypothetical protein
MQALSSFLAQEPWDPLFAFVTSPVSSAWKNVAVTCITIILLITPASLCVRFIQDSASALGHHDPRSHIPYYLAAAPLLLAASLTAAHFLLKVKQLHTIAAVCAAVEWSGVTLSAFAAVFKLQVFATNENRYRPQTTIVKRTQGLAPSARWTEVFAFYFVATIASFIAGTVADLRRGSSTRRLPLTLVAALLLALKLDDNTSHACLPCTPPPPSLFNYYNRLLVAYL